MTPQEIFEYKMKWMPGHEVRIHSDVYDEAVAWCKQWLQPWHWKVTKWTYPYEHTFHFVGPHMAKGLSEALGKFANQERV